MKKSLLLSDRASDYLWIIMRYSVVTSCIIFCFCTFAFANSSFSQKVLTHKVTADLNNVTLENALEMISSSAGVKIAYSNQILKKTNVVNKELKNESLGEVLTKLLAPAGLSYSVVEDVVVIVKSSEINNNLMLKELAAEHEIRGIVTDSTGVGLPGVSVMVKGKPGTGVATDQNGNFKIRVDDRAVLVLRMVGFITQEVQIDDRSFFSIRLREDVAALREVVVVGYGTQKKTNITGALNSVSTAELIRTPTASLTNTLAGRLPGLVSIQGSGEPGADGSALYIRGFGSYNGQSPLVLVDGIENAIDRIDANEVETVTVLKDAAATAVYGMKGANGVILVTTKRGKVSKPAVSLTSQLSVQTPTRIPEYLDSYNALSLYREGLINDGLNANLYTDEYLNKFRDRSNPTYQYLYPNTNWQDELLKPNSLMYQTNLNVSGGTPNTRYFVSMTYLNQDGLYKFEDLSDYNIQAKLNKYNFRSNVDIDVTKHLALELNLSNVVRDRNYPNESANDFWNQLRVTPPWLYPVTNPDGSIPQKRDAPVNPYGRLTQYGYKRLFENTMGAIVGFNLKLPFVTPGLSARARFAFDAQNYRDITRKRNYSTYRFTIDENQTDLSKGVYEEMSTGDQQLEFDLAANGSRKSTFEGYLNYDRTFGGKHSVLGMLRYNQSQDFRGTSRDDGGVAALAYKQMGIVGRINYTYDRRYVAEFDAGYNGSENFRTGRRMGFFPAGSLAWVASNEGFLKNSRTLSLLKFRGSFGTVGVDNSSNRFPYISTWTTGGNSGYRFGVDADGNGYSSAQERIVGNQFLTWERARKTNVGIDLGFFKGSLTLTGDVFQEHRTKILTDARTIPDVLGIETLPKVNAGVVDNKGFELELGWRKMIRQHQLFMRANYSYAKNEIKYAAEPEYAYPYQALKGTQIYEAQGLIALGLFKDQADIDNSPSQAGYGRIQPGDIKYLDRNQDGIINSQDGGYIGETLRPKSMMGLTLGYGYKWFDVNVLFQGALGGYNWLTGTSAWAFSRNSAILADYKDNHWTPGNLDATYPRISSADNVNNNQNSTFWLRSSDYLRLKNVEIGYTLPKSVLRRLSLKNVRVFATGVNLYTWDKFKIYDPEIPDGFGSYPQQKVVNLGFNVTL
ncbi:SusC/RagA family TonB-linked outer membrane protein [Desertivirga arenae]|uniref:SusC/RagA family TonB-linked outer membrane protein n=1 Tax=Desertivirga arenae TaxID=2810309 RepID=UPI001A958D18|nr:TonB-dependent receptor [Pedobacter sp. SYSU D00823]